MSKAIVLTKVTSGNADCPMAINVANFIEMTFKNDNESWFKYWDGTTVRTAVVTESVNEVVLEINDD